MFKKLKFKNSTLLLIGLIIIIIGVSIGLYEYFVERKNETFIDMNIKLYESELPEIIYKEENEESIEEEKENSTEEIIKDENDKNNSSNENYNYIGILEIPKINLKNGFFDINSRYNNVDYNVTIIKGSTFPGTQNNNLILAAHSGNCPVCYFDKLYKLQLNDEAYLFYNNIKYVYRIVDIYNVEKDGTVAIYRDNNKNTLTLITCTRNSSTEQTVYILEQV